MSSGRGSSPFLVSILVMYFFSPSIFKILKEIVVDSISVAWGKYIQFAGIVVGICGYLILSKYKAQAVLICGGFVMMAFAIAFNFGAIVPAKMSTGFIWFDIFQFVNNLSSKRNIFPWSLVIFPVGIK